MGEQEAEKGLALAEGDGDEPRGGACLVFFSGPKLGARFDITAEKVTLGVDESCDIRLEDKSLSGVVAEVSKAKKELLLRRLEGKGKLLKAGNDVEEATLQHEQHLQVGETVFKVLISSDLEKAYHEQIYWLMTHDAATGLFNKRYLLESLDRQMSRARRWNTPLSVAIFQIPAPESSDRSTEEAGQLTRIAEALLSSARSDDVIARVDDVTFVLALYRTHPDGAEVLCNRILESLSPDDPHPKMSIAAMDVTSLNGETLLETAMRELE